MRVLHGRIAAASLVSVAVLLGAAAPGHADFKGYFDVAGVSIPQLSPPDWDRRAEGQGVRFVCVVPARCPLPTGIEIKGVLRTEALPGAFVRGPLSPAQLTQQGEINAQARGSRFLGAVPIKIAGIEGVQMTAAAGAEGRAIHFLTTWLGRGDRMLDVKITTPDLDLARKLAADVLEPLVVQVFK